MVVDSSAMSLPDVSLPGRSRWKRKRASNRVVRVLRHGSHDAGPSRWPRCRVQRRVQGGVEHVAGDGLDAGVRAGRAGVLRGAGGARWNGSGSRCPGGSASRRPTGRVVVTARNRLGGRDRRAESSERLATNSAISLGRRATAGPRRPRRQPRRVDAVLGVLGLRLLLALGGGLPLAVQLIAFSRSRPRSSCSWSASRAAQHEALEECLDDAVGVVGHRHGDAGRLADRLVLAEQHVEHDAVDAVVAAVDR